MFDAMKFSLMTLNIIDIIENNNIMTHSISIVYRYANSSNCYAEHHFAECHYAECHYDKCHYAECHYDECHYADRHYDECYYAEC